MVAMRAKARKRDSIVRKNENVTHEDKRFVSLVTEDGKRHSYLNSAVPRRRELAPSGGGIETAEPIAPMEQAICQKCGHGYSHLMHYPSSWCSECKNQLARLIEKRLRMQLDTKGTDDWDDYRKMQAREMPVPWMSSHVTGFHRVRSCAMYLGALRDPQAVRASGLYRDRDHLLVDGDIAADGEWDNTVRAYEGDR